jgi:hypothetical protein
MMGAWFFRCRDVTRKVSQGMDASLPLHQRLAVRLHLAMCRHCSRFQRQLKSLRKLSRQNEASTTGEPLSPEAKKRIKEALQP